MYVRTYIPTYVLVHASILIVYICISVVLVQGFNFGSSNC